MRLWLAVGVAAVATFVVAGASGGTTVALEGSDTITTFAGTGVFGFSGDGGSATSANLNTPVGVAVDAQGNLYIADTGNNRVRKVAAKLDAFGNIIPGGIITTFAGSGVAGFSGDGGPATTARLSSPWGVAVDGQGNVYIADEANNRVREVNGAGTITTVAGGGSTFGDGGPATSAQLSQPMGVAVDGQGNFYIADRGNSRVRKVTSGGTITTLAGTGVSGYSGDGGAASAAKVNLPAGVAADGPGNVYIADTNNHRVRKVDTFGIISTFAGSGVFGFSGDGGPATVAQLATPTGVALDAQGNLLIADDGNARVRRVDLGGTITTIAGNGTCCSSGLGDGGPATSAQLLDPRGVALDAKGNLYIATATGFAGARMRWVDAHSQTITFGALVAKTYGDPDFTIGATASSGLTVSFAALGNCTVTGSTVHILAAGSCTITATQPGAADWTAAPEVIRSFLINKANQAITVSTHAPASAGLSTTFTVAASAPGGGVTYSSGGACTSSGATFTTASSRGTCTVKYDQSGNTNYNAAPELSEFVTVEGLAQAITVTTHAPVTSGLSTSFTVAATAPGGAVSYSSAGACTNSGATFTTASSSGTCTVQYDQSGSATYGPAPQVTESVTVGKLNQSITVSTHAPANASTSTSFTVAATAPGGAISYSSSGACTNSGATFTTGSSGGTCTVGYDQFGNASYNPAPQVTESVTVTATSTSKLNQTIAFGALASRAYGDADFAVSASASSGLAVSFTATGNCTVSGSTVHITGAGSCAVSASQAGNVIYNAAPTVSQTFSVGKAGQAITFGPLGDKTYGDVDFTVSATASSTLAVSFAAGGSCTLTAATVHLTGVGSCTVTASQAGNVNYNAAADVARTFSIAPKSVLNPAQTCKVPRVVGKRLAAAKLAIKRRHCRTGTVRKAYSRKVKKGVVVSQSRRAGKVVAANSKINLVVSKGRAPSTRTTASGTAQLVTFVDGIEKALIRSAASRRKLAAALTAGFSCSSSPRAVGQQVASVAASRQTILGQLGSVKATTQQSSRVLALLKTALQESIRADLYYRDGFFKVVVPQGGCPLPPNANFKLAAKSDARATTVKKQFVAAFNPLAKSLHRAAWSAGKI
jgi:sugar lactone lactonase YvrE